MTYSIVARDPATGALGVAVQSHYFCVGVAVPWAEAGVGAVATQAMSETSYGPLGLELMRGGKTAAEALRALIAGDAQESIRQVAMVDALGGVIPAIEQGFFQREIADAAYRYQMELDRKEKIIVGVNEFTEEEERIEIPILQISPEVEMKQRKRNADVRNSRNAGAVDRALSDLRDAAADGRNLLPPLLECATAYATLGEMCTRLAEVFGVYDEAAVF